MITKPQYFLSIIFLFYFSTQLFSYASNTGGILTTVGVIDNSSFLASSKNLQDKTLKEITAKGAKVIVIVECLNDTIQQPKFEDCILSAIKRQNTWIITNKIDEADFILKIQGYIVEFANPYAQVECIECYPTIFSTNFEPLWVGKRVMKGGTVFINLNDRIKNTSDYLIETSLEKELAKANIIPDSPVSHAQLKDSTEYNKLVTEAYRLYEQKSFPEAIKSLNKVIKIFPDPDIVSLRIMANLELRNVSNAKNDIDLLSEIDPYNPDIDLYILEMYNVRYGRDAKLLAVASALQTFSNSLNAIMTSVNQQRIAKNIEAQNSYQSNSTTATSSYQSSEKKSKTCSFCSGTGVSPIAATAPSFGTDNQKWCDVCKKWVSLSHGAHPRCPSCKGKGYK
ncbi:MAG: hypothetical protein RR066_05535 [Mucinivorans sp.]